MKLETPEDVLRVVDEYRAEVERRGLRWDWRAAVEALQESGGDVGWLADGQIEGMIEMYLFQRPHAALAFDVPYLKQPSAWVEAKIILEQILN